MESLPTFFEDALLEDYEDAMEVTDPATVAKRMEVLKVPVGTDLPLIETDSIRENSSITAAVNPEQAPPSIEPTENAGSNVPASHSPTGRQQINMECSLCKKNHSLRGCFRFRKLRLEDRLRHVLVFGYCCRCLNRTHATKDCKSAACCAKCQGSHNILLHSSNGNSRRPNNQTRVARAATTSRPTSISAVSPLPLRHFITFSPTLQVKLLHGRKQIQVRAVLDLCCSHSYISDQLVRQINLPAIRVNNDSYCHLTIGSIYDHAQKISMTAKLFRMKRVKTPIEDVSEVIREHYGGFQLADPTFYKSGQVALVLGPELSPQILKGRIHSSPGFPLAQYTIFGWVISGPSPL